MGEWVRFELWPRSLAGEHPRLFDLQQAQGGGASSLSHLTEVPVYWVKPPPALAAEQLQAAAQRAFYCPITESPGPPAEATFAGMLEVHFLPGVTDNPGRVAAEALAHLGAAGCEVRSARLYAWQGEENLAAAHQAARDILFNPLIQRGQLWSGAHSERRFEQIPAPLKLEGDRQAREIDLAVPWEELAAMNRQHCWALGQKDLAVIAAYFGDPGNRRKRRSQGLDGPTDVEMEILAQTWSEHCKHRIFNASISFIDQHGDTHAIKSLFQTYIKGSTETILQEKGIDWAISLFSDNAGVVRFDENLDVAIKVETHNSPSALDPYGGALTGILGVNRDILGAGLGAKPVANCDVFCVGPLDLPDSLLPEGLRPPRVILRGIHQGVQDGGNKSGIPTVSGAIHFHPGFSGKPLVYCGTLGLMPPHTPAGKPSWQKRIRPGDWVVIAGGRVGADGIHGATFSSQELGENGPATAVQIGDPLTQKRLSDFLLAAFEQELYSGVTDNGAGGVSSSVGEMAQASGGASLDLKKMPVKYPGLGPKELIISESQERMTFSVPPENLPAFEALAKRFDVEICVAGSFHDQGVFDVYYGADCVAYLDLDFMHQGDPDLELTARESPVSPPSWPGPRERPVAGTLLENLATLLAHPDVASKESWVRRYDQEVKGATAGRPFEGPEQSGPQDGGVIDLHRYGGRCGHGLAMGHGLAPRLSALCPWSMGQKSVAEALANVLALGADPSQVALVDNFCWPDPVPSSQNPEGEKKLAQLVRTCQGMAQACQILGAPLVSGKDSMKNDVAKEWRGQKLRISVPPTLLITAVGHVPDLERRPKATLRPEQRLLFGLQALAPEWAGSVYADTFQGVEQTAPQWEMAPVASLFADFFAFWRQARGRVSGHDASDGGLLCAAAEMTFGGPCSLRLHTPAGAPEKTKFWFGEAPGHLLVAVEERDAPLLEKIFGQRGHLLGRVTSDPAFQLDGDSVAKEKLQQSWQSFMARWA